MCVIHLALDVCLLFQAETVTAKMISEGRMDGSIDQISGVVHFKRKTHKQFTSKVKF